MEAYINAIEYYLPKKVRSNRIINQEFPEWDADKISKKTGIHQRHIAAVDEYASDMAIKAAKKLIEENGIERSSIDFLIYCTQSPDYFLPTTACILQEKLNLSNSIGAYDFNLGCSGYVYGLSMAKAYVASGMASKVLLITSNTYSKMIHKADKSNKTIFGDAASATLVSNKKGKWRIGNFEFGTDGSGAENLIVKNGGIRNKNKKGYDELNEDNSFKRNDDYIYMNGGAIFNFTSKAVPKLINSLADKNNFNLEDIDAIVPHQANKYMLEYIRRKVKVPSEKFIYHLENVGNTVSNTIAIALKEKCELKAYKNILLAGFGVGYSWAGCFLEKA